MRNALWITLCVLLGASRFAHAEETIGRQLKEASSTGKIAEVQRLLDAGADINTGKELGLTPLYFATLDQHEDIALLLIEKGADVNLMGGPHSDTPLMNAAAFNELSIIKALLKHGARTDLRCRNGMTARDHAVRNHHVEAAKLIDNSGKK
jgi:uncharacterized protein